MKTSFWLSEDPIGEDIICPRDGRPGCALVDWIPRRERREQTHFMSWTWKYSLQQVQAGKSRVGSRGGLCPCARVPVDRGCARVPVCLRKLETHGSRPGQARYQWKDLLIG